MMRVGLDLDESVRTTERGTASITNAAKTTASSGNHHQPILSPACKTNSFHTSSAPIPHTAIAARMRALSSAFSLFPCFPADANAEEAVAPTEEAEEAAAAPPLPPLPAPPPPRARSWGVEACVCVEGSSCVGLGGAVRSID